MQILWAFRCNPLRSSLEPTPGIAVAIPGQRITKGNSLRATRRSQFCSDKIAWSATKHSA
ncbi:MAG: hypothetical protein LBK44_06740 [Spirochaetales bacterium]|nr:hypothetical protein [Spirochaetales bacterium]